MKDRPIIFSAEMVRAILDGRKTQTRRIVKPQPNKQHHIADVDGFGLSVLTRYARVFQSHLCCPYGVPGDRLWVREAWSADYPMIRYRADNSQIEVSEEHRPTLRRLYDTQPESWRSPIHMPRWASRLTLEIQSLRVERVQDMRRDDFIAEGIESEFQGAMVSGLSHEYKVLFDKLNGPGSWDANPWVWVIAFKRIEVA